MSRSRLAGRYAKALYRLDSGNADLMQKHHHQLEQLGELFKEKGIRRVLVSPVMPNELKFEILSYVMDKLTVGPELKNFVKAVVDAGRVAIFESIAGEYKTIINDKNNTAEAVVTTTVPLNQQQLSEISSVVGQKIGKKLILNQKVDPSILGGFVIDFGNSLIDLSLKTKLNEMAACAVK